MSFIGLGMTASVLGPSLPYLAEQTHVQLKQASVLFTAVNLGYLIGALAGGRQFDRRPGHPVVSLALVMIAVPTALIPGMPRWRPGACDAAARNWSGLRGCGWQHAARLAAQGAGEPIYEWAAPFLGSRQLHCADPDCSGVLRTSAISWAYWLIALLLLPVALLFRSITSPPAPHDEPDARPQVKPSVSLMALFILFYLTFTGAEMAYGGWIYSYAIATGIASAAAAAYMTSVYWGALTIGRLISIPFAVRFPPRTLLAANLAGCLFGLGLALFGGGSPETIWIATIIFGASVATIFPVTLSFANQILTVTGQFTSWIFVGASLGGMIIPWLIGQFFETSGPQTMMYILAVDMVISSGIFVLLSRKKT